MTKKTSTPTYPPRAVWNPAWKNTTPSTAMDLRTSISGRYFKVSLKINFARPLRPEVEGFLSDTVDRDSIVPGEQTILLAGHNWHRAAAYDHPSLSRARSR